ncbi:phytanoyl-CoA dioxygenase family protein [Streptomyces liangshanensis]|uniref:Phytanoyl-CoA dioxygenase family protein n=1 Tax=Streptomyces liangshanensis TaxID=2717324 RepID=A0A6G9H0Q7_9ACTN|nr:phytanoyl-CoA dioxygenase family protein [Streptomyces liangshanensis]QIQ03791.1 phytanoyl-CoA dioxygenase family protein [Streptomyces liangshanensis]
MTSTLMEKSARLLSDDDLDTYKKQYWKDGYTVLRGLYTPAETESYRREVERLFHLDGLDDDLNLRTEFRRGPDGRYAFDRLDPVLDISPGMTDAAKHPALLGALRTILDGSPEVLKCKLIRKEPGTNGYIPHQDFLYWRWLDESPDKLCTAVINLYPSDARNGGLGFYRGTHHALLPGPASDPQADCDPTALDAASIDMPALEPGDVLVFHSLAVHFSGRNAGEVPRTVLLPSYCATDDSGLYRKYYQREVVRRCKEMVGFERYFERNAAI